MIANLSLDLLENSGNDSSEKALFPGIYKFVGKFLIFSGVFGNLKPLTITYNATLFCVQAGGSLH